MTPKRIQSHWPRSPQKNSVTCTVSDCAPQMCLFTWTVSVWFGFNLVLSATTLLFSRTRPDWATNLLLPASGAGNLFSSEDCIYPPPLFVCVCLSKTNFPVIQFTIFTFIEIVWNCCSQPQNKSVVSNFTFFESCSSFLIQKNSLLTLCINVTVTCLQLNRSSWSQLSTFQCNVGLTFWWKKTELTFGGERKDLDQRVRRVHKSGLLYNYSVRVQGKPILMKPKHLLNPLNSNWVAELKSSKNCTN